MFDFLKKKISSITEKLKNTIEKKEPTQEQTTGQQVEEQPKQQEPIKEKQEFAQEIEEKETTTQEVLQPEPVFEQEKENIIELDAPKKPTAHIAEEKRKLKAKVGIAKKIKGLFTGQITISENDIEELLSELEFALLEADVQAQTAEQIVGRIKKDFVGKKIQSSQQASEFLKQEIKKALIEIMQTQKIDLLEQMKNKKPFVILFLGPNGAGKTTSIAKLANYLKKKGKTVVLCAADTFRAASIEQLEVHARALDIKIIKHNYGADPAAVAFDAIAFAKSKNTDVVLIDSAGRQQTNKNLIEELKKIERIAKPDLKIFVGEAYAGQSLLEQASEFNKALKIDAFILTKIDADAKGGSAISLLANLKKPILFVGVGQKYDDLVEFEPKFIVERII